MYSKHKSKITNVNTNVISFLERLSASKRQTLDFLLNKANIHEIIYPAQTNIAKKIGCTRKTVNINIAEFSDSNLIRKQTRLWNTCIYSINPILNDPELRWALRHIFKAFKVRPLLPLLFIPFVTAEIKENKISFHNHMLHHISSSFPSSSFFTYLYNNTHLTNVSTCVEEKKSKNVRNYKVEESVTNSQLNLNNSYKSKKDVVMLQKVKEMLGLGEYETTQLSKFDDKVLAEALRIVNNKRDVSNKFKFLLGCCNKIVERMGNKETNNGTMKDIKQFVDADIGIVPNIDLDFDGNIQKWLNYEQQAQSWSEQSDFHRNILANRKLKFMHDLDKHTPENLERWRKYAAELREAYPYEQDGVKKFVESLSFKPESTTLHDSGEVQPKAQQNNKSSTDWKFEAISKYRQNTQFEQIRDFINGINYDPSNEQEDFDSPLML